MSNIESVELPKENINIKGQIIKSKIKEIKIIEVNVPSKEHKQKIYENIKKSIELFYIKNEVGEN